MMFWTHQDPAGDMASSTLIHFTAVLGIHRHSLAYRQPHHSTSGFAGLIWVGRILFLEYALPRSAYATLPLYWPARHTYPSQVDRLGVIRTKYLLRGSQGPFAEIIELKAFAKSIVRQEGMLGNLSWASDGQSFTIGDNQKIRILDFCTIHYTVLTQVTAQVNEMMLGWDPAINLATIQDDLTCLTPGWSFIDHKQNHFTFAYKALSRLKSPRLLNRTVPPTWS